MMVLIPHLALPESNIGTKNRLVAGRCGKWDQSEKLCTLVHTGHEFAFGEAASIFETIKGEKRQ